MSRLTAVQLATLKMCQHSGIPDRRGCVSPRTLEVLLRLKLVYLELGGGGGTMSVWASTYLGDKVIENGGRLS